MTTKYAADLQPGDVVDLTIVQPYAHPVRTVDHIEWTANQMVRVHWREDIGHTNVQPDKELTIR